MTLEGFALQVEYRTTGRLPEGVPAAVVSERGRVVIVLDEHLTVQQVCEVLTPLITEHARALRTPGEAIASPGVAFNRG